MIKKSLYNTNKMFKKRKKKGKGINLVKDDFAPSFGVLISARIELFQNPPVFFKLFSKQVSEENQQNINQCGASCWGAHTSIMLGTQVSLWQDLGKVDYPHLSSCPVPLTPPPYMQMEQKEILVAVDVRMSAALSLPGHFQENNDKKHQKEKKKTQKKQAKKKQCASVL